jgi:predicted amidohydrolase
MNIALIQSDIYWENKEKNFLHFSEKIKSLNENTDVIVLPEMFTTGFTMNSQKFAEKIGEKTTEWMLQMASEKKSCLTGSFITKENDSYYNTLLWAYPDGKFQFYHKRHLFRMAEEHKHYSSGKSKIICEYKGVKFLPLICYDLRFPVWSRNRFNVNNEFYDVLIYVANWPQVRIDAWKKLLFARAIENLSYVVGVNRIGIDGTHKEYNGQSMAINFKGECIVDCEDNDVIKVAKIDIDELKSFREKFPAYLDADDFNICY